MLKFFFTENSSKGLRYLAYRSSVIDNRPHTDIIGIYKSQEAAADAAIEYFKNFVKQNDKFNYFYECEYNIDFEKIRKDLLEHGTCDDGYYDTNKIGENFYSTIHIEEIIVK